MKKTIYLLFILIAFMWSCQEKQEGTTENPLLSEYTAEFGVPPFDDVKIEHFVPAFEEGMKQHKENIDAIINNPEEPTFDNTIVAYFFSDELLGKVRTVFRTFSGVRTNDELQQLAQEIYPKLSTHRDEIRLNPKLFERIKVVYKNKDKFDLTEEEKFLLENFYKGFIRSGADLPDDKKEKLKEINQKLSSLTLNFSQNVLKETNKFKLVIEDEADLEGLPESVITAASEAATANGMEGKWIFTTHKPSMIPFLQYAENRDLREKLYKAYINRGNNDDENDNKEILEEIINLRIERAHLLGYDNHANYTLELRMAKNAENAQKLLMQLWEAALPVAKAEAKELQAMIDEEGKDFKLQSWDWWYYAEKVRKAKYNLDDSELRPYFQLENVRDGAFYVAEQLYGITFKPLDNVPLPHSEAEAFEVFEADGSHLGVLFLDFHPRESKRGGAWCGRFRSYHIKDGKEITPLVTMVMNFTRPTGDVPALLSLDEVSTLFHEFGHALDGLFQKTTYPATYVAWDFVELPSQIMEHWVTEPEVLKVYAKHYKTGEPIPDELIEKMEKSGNFNQGFATVEYLAAALLDLEYHTLEETQNIDILDFEKEYFDQIGLIPEIISRYRSTYFNHIMGGYDAGYYSYIWAGVLDNDAYEAFKETSLFDKETAQSFRENILEKNGIKDAMEMYKDFRGREPEIEPLLKNRGLK